MLVHIRKIKFHIVYVLLISNFSFSQALWKSSKYNYQVEIPKGFSINEAVGANVDFKAVDKSGNSIIIVVKKIPNEYKNQSIFQVLGDLEEFANYWIEGSKEVLETPRLIKFGKTRVSNYDSFWLDYTTSYDKYYSKNYSIKKGDLIISLSFFSTKREWNYYSPIWFRFKEQMEL